MWRQRKRQRADAHARITGATGDCVAAPRNRLAVRARSIRCVSALMECCLTIPPPLPAVTRSSIFWCSGENLLLSSALCKERTPRSSRPASTKRSLEAYEFAPAIPQHPDPITQRQRENQRSGAGDAIRVNVPWRTGWTRRRRSAMWRWPVTEGHQGCSGSSGYLTGPHPDRSGGGPAVIERILAHLNGKASSTEPAMLPEDRAPLQARRLD